MFFSIDCMECVCVFIVYRFPRGTCLTRGEKLKVGMLRRGLNLKDCYVADWLLEYNVFYLMVSTAHSTLQMRFLEWGWLWTSFSLNAGWSFRVLMKVYCIFTKMQYFIATKKWYILKQHRCATVICSRKPCDKKTWTGDSRNLGLFALFV